jgi:hypothetical protein
MDSACGGSRDLPASTRPLADSRQHPRANLVLIAMGKLVVRRIRAREQPMRAALAFRPPADALQCCENPPGLLAGQLLIWNRGGNGESGRRELAVSDPAGNAEKMKALAAQGMRDGAFGLSTGLYYAPAMARGP